MSLSTGIVGLPNVGKSTIFNALTAAGRFHAMAATDAANGGFWVSAGGGTANVVAGEIARPLAALSRKRTAPLA